MVACGTLKTMVSVECGSEVNLREVLGEEAADEWEIPKEAYPVLHKLARKWTDIIGVRDFTLTPVKGAMTNQVFECHWPATDDEMKPRKVLVRVYGESSVCFFRREDEVLTFERMSQHGQGPRLLARFPNGRVEEFLHARTLSAADLRNVDISDRIAEKLRDFHGLNMPGPIEPKLWLRLREWNAKALELASPECIKKFQLLSFTNEINELERRLSKPEARIGFCHNDLQYGNILIDENDSSVTIIDYEYATFNPVAFDIGNHFCEMAADYHTDVPHLLDYSKYPDSEERARFVRTYLRASGEEVSEEDVNDLVMAAEMNTLSSHIHWGLWGIISACSSDIDFDFLDYTRQRFEQYSISKLRLFGQAESLQ